MNDGENADDDKELNTIMPSREKSHGLVSFSSSDSSSSDSDSDVFVPLTSKDDGEYIRMIRVDPDKILLPQTITNECVSKYRLGKRIGCGSQALIFEGADANVVIRVASIENQTDKLQQFKRDVEIRRKLQDRNCKTSFVQLLDAFICNNKFGVEVMPKADGNLLDLVYKHGSIKLIEMIMEKSVEALKGLHECRIVHRDIGFQNILYKKNGADFQILLTDFEGAADLPSSDRRMDQAFDGYSVLDTLALEKMREELISLQILFQALDAGDKETAVNCWERRLNSFVKTVLNCSYPEVRTRLNTLK